MTPSAPQVAVRVEPGGQAVVTLSGPLDVRTAARVRSELTRGLAGLDVTAVEVDASRIDRGDVSGMVVLYELTIGRSTPRGLRARLTGLRPELQKLLSAFPPDMVLDRLGGEPEKPSLPEEVGAAAVHVMHDAQDQVSFIGGVVLALSAATRRPHRMRWGEVGAIFEKAGANAIPIVSLVSLLTGLVIAFESAEPFARYGAQIFIADTIGLAMIRELGPIMTAVVFAGRSGSAFAAELGTMKIDEELDALETMGLDPIRFLVIERIVASTLLAPLLTAYSMLMGVLGGAIVMLTLGFSPVSIWTELAAAVRASDLAVGLLKGTVFGATVAGVGCQRGMATKQGPSAVGQSATRAVVASIVLIIMIDSLAAVVTYLLHV